MIVEPSLASVATALRVETGTDVAMDDLLQRYITAATSRANKQAPDAPQDVAHAAIISFTAWLFEGQTATDGTSQAGVWHRCGAKGMLSPWTVRRAGVIGGTAAAAIDTDIDVNVGTSVMRCGFTNVLPFTDDIFRWIGTANGVELDTSWTQPSAFGFWLPNDLMSRIVEVVLLRSIQVSLSPDVVNIAAFGPAIAYQFGDTVGMLRHTVVTFNGNFSLPNDFRAVIGSLR